MFQAKDISYTANNRKILDQVSAVVFPGKITAIVGPNGAGKSTLLKVLSQDITPQSGQVTLNNTAVDQYAPRQLAKLRAVLPQKTNVTLAFTALEVVLLGRIPHDTSGKENLAIALEVMEEADVLHLKDRIYQTLSGGEQQRVHLARVLAQLHYNRQQPTYLLLDEPTSSLDIAQQHGLLSVAKKRCEEEGFGIAAVIHDLNLAAQYADYFLFMKNGKEVGQGPSQMMLRKEMIERTFEHPVELIYAKDNETPLIYTKGHCARECALIKERNINYEINGKLNH